MCLEVHTNYLTWTLNYLSTFITQNHDQCVCLVIVDMVFYIKLEASNYSFCIKGSLDMIF